MHEIVLPELGEDINNAIVAKWHARPGDAVREDDDVVEVVTDKATFHVPAGCRGKIREIRVPEGGTAEVGGVLGTVAPD